MTGSAGITEVESPTNSNCGGRREDGWQTMSAPVFGISALASSTRRDASLCLSAMSSPARSSRTAFLGPETRLRV